MKTAFAILAAISFGGVGLNAQSVQVPGASASCVQKLDDKRPCPAPEQAPAACPVSMQATHLADGSFVKTDTAHPRGVGQWLSLALTDSDDKQIVKATLKVHGVKPNGHVTQALSGANGPDNITQTLTVPFPSKPYRNAPTNSWVHQEARANLWVSGMSAVDRIDLESLDYNDGSTWNVADRHSCSVVPDPKMLITSR